MRRLHVLGRRELSLLVGGEDKLPTPEQAPLPRLQPECEEAAIPAQYGAVEDRVMLRTLQDFCFYHEGRSIDRAGVGGWDGGGCIDGFRSLSIDSSSCCAVGRPFSPHIPMPTNRRDAGADRGAGRQVQDEGDCVRHRPAPRLPAQAQGYVCCACMAWTESQPPLPHTWCSSLTPTPKTPKTHNREAQVLLHGGRRGAPDLRIHRLPRLGRDRHHGRRDPRPGPRPRSTSTGAPAEAETQAASGAGGRGGGRRRRGWGGRGGRDEAAADRGRGRRRWGRGGGAGA